MVNTEICRFECSFSLIEAIESEAVRLPFICFESVSLSTSLVKTFARRAALRNKVLHKNSELPLRIRAILWRCLPDQRTLMHVLVTTDTISGVWSYTRELVSGLVSRGLRVTLVSFGEVPLPDKLRGWIACTAWTTARRVSPGMDARRRAGLCRVRRVPDLDH